MCSVCTTVHCAQRIMPGIDDEHILCKVKNTTEYCVKRINKCKHGPIDGILSGHGGKPGTYYPDLEPGNKF